MRDTSWSLEESIFARDNDFATYSAAYPERTYNAYRVHRMRVHHLSNRGTRNQQMRQEVPFTPAPTVVRQTQEEGEPVAVNRFANAEHPEPSPIEKARLRLIEQQQARIYRTIVGHCAEDYHVFDGIAGAIQALPSPAPAAVPFRRRRGKRALVLLYSDAHCGLRATSTALGGLGGFDVDIWEERHNRLQAAVCEAQETFQADELIELGLGDLMDGQDIFKSQSYHIDKSVPEQVVLAGQRLAKDMAVYAGVFPRIRNFFVLGNHGRKGRYDENPYAVNYESIVYELARAYTRDMSHITWEGSDSWYQVVDILGLLFVILHGDDIRSFGPNLPAGMMRTKQSYMSMLNMPFDYLCAGHHHRAFSDPQLLANGSFVGATEFTAKKLSVVGLPSQKLFVVDEGVGLTWMQDVPLATWDEMRSVKIYGR